MTWILYRSARIVNDFYAKIIKSSKAHIMCRIQRKLYALLTLCFLSSAMMMPKLTAMIIA